MHRLDDPSFVRKNDPKGMIDLTEGFPAQCREAFSIAKAFDFPDNLRHCKSICVAGLGGSAAGGDFLRALMDESGSTNVVVWRDYGLPSWVDNETLVIACSYSGNTEETLSAVKTAKERGSKLLAITSGGELESLGFPTCKIPGGQPPRTALGYLFVPLAIAAEALGYLPEQDFDSAFGLLDQCKELWGMESHFEENEAKRIAERLVGCVPLVYGSGTWGGLVANRWKGQLCENAKVLAFANCFPELNHNEIMGWEGSEKQNVLQWSVLVLESGDESQKMRKRIDVSCEILQSKAELRKVRPLGSSLLERMLSLIYLGDFVSIYLAALNDVDPETIDSINKLKAELSKVS